MPVGSATSTPIDANTSNIDGTESNSSSGSTSGTSDPEHPCLDALDNIGNAAGDLADSVRDFFTGDASGRDVWDSYKDVAEAGGEAIDTCIDAY